jgi:pimeloyl-ACP methyl ester carboxylesterase
MGAAVALRFALLFPQRVAGLILLTPAYGGAELGLSDFQRERFALMDELGRRAARGGVSALRPIYEASPAMAAYFDAVSPTWDAGSFAATAALMGSLAQPFERQADLRRLTCPTLLIRGDDPMHPADVSDVFAAEIPGCVVRPPAQDAESAIAIADFIAKAAKS